MKTTRKFTALVITVAMVLSLMPTLTSWAKATTRETWTGTQTTGNLIPTMKDGDSLTAVGWGNIGNQISPVAETSGNTDFDNRVGIMARTSSDDIGESKNSNYAGGVYWPIEFSDGDRMKIKKEDLWLSVSAKYWFQASSNHDISLRLEFFNENNVLINNSNWVHNDDRYYVSSKVVPLSMSNVKIPSDTAYVRIWFSNWGSNSGKPFIGDFYAALTDKTASAYVNTTVVSDPGTYKIGDKIRFRVEMDEPVNVTDGGTLTVNGATAVYAGQELGESDDIGQYIYYDLTVTEDMTSGNNVPITAAGISGLKVKDDAGNSTTINNSNLAVSADGVYYDNQCPSLTAAKLVRVNGSEVLLSQVLPENTVTYSFTFDEALSYSTLPTLAFSVNGTTFSVAASEGSIGADGKTLSFTATLPNCAKNGDLVLTGISGIDITDEHGNSFTYEKYNLSVSEVYYKSMFTVSETLTHITLASGMDTVNFKKSWTGTLKADTGYHLPDAITIVVGDNALDPARYTYNSETGVITIKEGYITSDVLITASAVENVYNVTYEKNGGTIENEFLYTSYTYGTGLTLPSPSRTGHTFEGWYTDKNFTSGKVTSITKTDLGDKTFYAKWTANTYTITYEKNGGTIANENNYAKYTYGVGLTLPTPTRIGYTFGGWYTNKDFTSSTVTSITQTDLGEKTFYAKWTANTYAVTYEKNGGTIENEFLYTSYTYGTGLTLPSPTRTGHTFEGWYTDKNFTSIKVASITKTDLGDKTFYAKWSANTYTVSYEKNGGTIANENNYKKYTYSVGLTLPVPTRTGYTFNGWYADSAFSTGRVDVISKTDLGNKTYYAQWIANQYTVTLNAMGGSGGGSITATYDSDMPGITMPARLGYRFKGYFTNENGKGTAYYDETGTGIKTYDVADGLTLYAYWVPITYNIQFYSKGAYVGSKNDVVYGELLLPSAEELGMSREHYTFVGWNIYDEQNWAMYTAGNLYPTGLVTEQGQTAYLYAAWLENDKYTITYDANGGGGAPGAEVVYAGDTIRLSDAVPTRTDYTFLGWSRNSSAEKPEYMPGGEFTMGNELVTLFAVWEPNPMLSYDPNGGSFSSYVESIRPAKGSTITLTSIEPSRQGYIFAGWALEADADESGCLGNSFVMPDKDTVLYAVWTAEKHRVTVKAAAGYSVNGIKDAGYEYGERVEFTVSGVNPKVYIDGVLTVTDEGVYGFTITGNTTVIVADKSTINVIYSANGGTDAPYDSKSYKEGDIANVSSQTPTRTGYKFSGWSEDSGAKSPEYNAGSSLNITEDTVLYAVWDANKYTIQFNSNGGSGSINPINAEYDLSIILPESSGLSNTGQQLEGWALYQDGPVVYSDRASVKNLSAEDGSVVTLYAVWRSAKTTIRLNPDGGSGGRTEASVSYGAYLTAVGGAVPFKYGYTFEGYYTGYGRSGEQIYDALLQPVGNYRTQPWNRSDLTLELYAGWKPVSYTIRFVNGNQYLTKTVNAVFGEPFTLPTAKELGITAPDGKYFAGWSNVAGSLTAYYSDGQTITTGLTGKDGDEITLYAVMSENEKYNITIPASGTGFTVSFDDEKLTAPRTVDRYKGGSVTFTVTIAEGYSADNMVVSAEGLAMGARTIDGNVYTYTVSNISSDMTINVYGITKKTFQVALNNGTGYTVSPMMQTITYGDKLEFTVTLAKGYETAEPVVYVNGVKIEAAEGTEYTYSVSPITSQPVVSISVVQKAQYTVTFMSGGSIYSISTVEEGQKVSAPTAPKRTGYTFDGWYQDESLKTPYNFNTEVYESVILYAKWTADGYTVEYNKNTTDDVGNMPQQQTKSHDTILTLSPEKPIRTGYTFTGWNTKADGSGTSYSAGGELAINVNITLYAQWERNKYIVSLSYGNGVTASIDKTEVLHGDTVTITASVTGEYKNPQITATPAENAKLTDSSETNKYVYIVTGPAAFAVTADSKKVYSVNFYLNNGTEGLYYSQSVIEGSNAAVILPAEPTREGYTFEGWFTEATGGQQVTSDTTVSGDMNVYAHWKANIFTVTPAANAEGYTVASQNDTTVEYGGSYSFTVTIAEHYNANNMHVYANGVLLEGNVKGSKYTFTINNITADQIISITGVEPDKHTVIYNVDGQVYQTVQAEYNTTLVEPAKPVKEGRSLKGWSEDGTNIWDFSKDTVTKDITLHAVWDGNTFTVTPAADGDGYTVKSSDSPIVEYGGSYSFTVTIAEHYNTNNMRVYANGVLIESSANGREYTFTINNITADMIISVTGVEIDIHTVMYKVDGGVYYETQAAYGSGLVVPAVPVKDGMEFAGWYKGDRRWNFDTDKVTEDIVLDAHWTDQTFSVILPPETDSYIVECDSANPEPIVYGDSYIFTITIKEGYNAENMAVYANGVMLTETEVNGNVYAYILENINEDKIITVKGIENDTFGISYNANTTEYIGNLPDGQVKVHGIDIKLSEMIPERRGYSFEGWSDSADGYVKYESGADYTEDADVTLYAVWKPKKYSVSFETNGGTINSGEIDSYTYGVGAVLPTDVTKANSKFLGWYDNASLEGAHIDKILPTDTEDKKYYAGWEIGVIVLSEYSGVYDGAEHTISFNAPDGISIINSQWYFKSDDMTMFMPIEGDINSISVKDVIQSGTYYCAVECMAGKYMTRFDTETAKVSITQIPVTLKAASASKVFDSTPLTESGYELTDKEALITGHTLTVTMAENSSITDVGIADNEVGTVIIKDSDDSDVTSNYEISTEAGRLEITPRILSVEGRSIRKTRKSSIDLNELYSITGFMRDETLILDSVSVTIKDEKGNTIDSLSNVTENNGIYTVEITYNGFTGDGSENYTGSGTVTSTITIATNSVGGGGGSGSGGGGASPSTVKPTPSPKPSESPNPVETANPDNTIAPTESSKSETKPNTSEYSCNGTVADNCPSIEFADMDTSLWYHLSVDYVLNEGLMSGYTDGSFAPEDNLSRAMLVTILHRAEGYPAVESGNSFDDVAAGSYYENAVSWAQSSGIVEGYSETEFGPDDSITREQIAAVMFRYAQYKGYDVSIGEDTNILSYTDAHMISEYAIPAVCYTVGSGLIKGRTDSTINPYDNTTRAEIATILQRFIEANK